MSLVAKAATCSTCGGILMGYRQDETLKFPVYFCPRCDAQKIAPAKPEVIPKVA